MTEENQNSLEVSGTIEHVTYENTSNGYCVLSLSTTDGELTCVGNMPNPTQGEAVKLQGSYTFHSVYGRQFKFNSYEMVAPEGAAAILRYLSSGAVKGIGPTTARKIVEKFSSNSLEIIENDYERLSTIRGISLAKAKKISDEYRKHNGIRDIMMQLSKYGITPDESNRIYKYLGKNTVEKVEKNPYILFNDDIGFGWERVVGIAAYFNIANSDLNRITAGVIHILKHNLQNGHTCVPKEKLLNLGCGLLECSEELISQAVDVLSREVKIKQEKFANSEYIFLESYYSAERYIATKLKIMLGLRPKPLKMPKGAIERLEKSFGIKYQEKQVEAINMAMEKGLLVLTGGPGTGKTTTLKAIIEILEESGFDVALAAPTGRAAKRMSEVTGKEAKTLHRLLEVEWDDNDKQVFSRNENNPLSYDAVIIDEMSMVDSLLFESLLRALTLGCRVIMVGDSNQLPSVGAGNVLSDIIDSGTVPMVELTEIFRQAMSSLIVTNAHKIVAGVQPHLDSKDKDFFMIDISDQKAVGNYILNLCESRLPKAYGYDTFSDIQILCPSKKTPVGTGVLNNLLQQRLNPSAEDKPEVTFKGYVLRLGDKVMQIKNNYDIEWSRDDGETGSGVYNGDIGFIEDINIASAKVTVRFDDKLAIYNLEETSQLELSYAVTIHKSQGSEFPCVIIPLLSPPEKLCYRNLLYTAVTRAKSNIIIIGDRTLVGKMTDNNRKTLRYTGLEWFLKE